MSRLMSVMHTEAAVVARNKTVTRRLGWLFLKPGDRLTLCRRVRGRGDNEKLVKLAEVEVVSVRRERLETITLDDIRREGVSTAVYAENHPIRHTSCHRLAWTEWFARTMGCGLDADVTRIEWRYLTDGPTAAGDGSDAS